MADIKLKFVASTDGHSAEVDLDESMTAQEAISELVNSGFVKQSTMGYMLQPKGKSPMQASQSFGNVGLTSGQEVVVIPATDAG